MRKLSRTNSPKPNHGTRQSRGMDPARGIEGEDELRNDEEAENGLAQLIMALVKVLLEVVERQAARVVDSDALEPEGVEKLGTALIRLRKSFARVCERFGIKEADLNRLPFGQVLDSSSTKRARSVNVLGSDIVEIIDRLIEKRTTISGEVSISLAGVELVVLHLLATLEPSPKVRSGHRPEILSVGGR